MLVRLFVESHKFILICLLFMAATLFASKLGYEAANPKGRVNPLETHKTIKHNPLVVE